VHCTAALSGPRGWRTRENLESPKTPVTSLWPGSGGGCSEVFVSYRSFAAEIPLLLMVCLTLKAWQGARASTETFAVP